MTKQGAEFEKVVFDFAKTLDPQAEILFDHRVPDRDTGTPRQCDVWINTRIGGHWPVSILVSCKDHCAPLDIGDIGTFCSEVHSTGASTGVIYSRTGFTAPALAKAKANGISCCRFYRNEPADVPCSIFFEQFACSPNYWLQLDSDLSSTGLRTWNDVFTLPEENRSVRDAMEGSIADAERHAAERPRDGGTFPADWVLQLKFSADATRPEIRIRVRCQWTWYRARREATLLNGSYCVSDNSFRGGVLGPTIDLRGFPGEGWTEIIDKSVPLPTNRQVILFKANITADLGSIACLDLPKPETTAN